jgi:hypothetical protein
MLVLTSVTGESLAAMGRSVEESTMRKVAISMTAIIACAAALWGQQVAPAPQTARQALIEMFFGKTPGTFAKHLPAITRTTLDKFQAMSNLQQFSLMANQMQTQGQTFKTFETGPVLLTSDNVKTGQKVDITVLDDRMRGDQDDIQLSFQVYKNGEAQRTPYMPQVTFSMKKEAELWTLNEVSLTIHLPLADPDLLKAFTDSMAPQPHSQITYSSQNETPVQTGGSDAMVLAAMRSILAAEVTYAASYPAVGYTCVLSDLDGFGGGEPNAHQAMLISSGLASGKKYGFVFTLSECAGNPAKSFRLTAAPNARTFGRKAFCADQSSVIRSSDDGNAATCMAGGSPIQ